MQTATTLRTLDFDAALARVEGKDAAFVDLRPIPDYLDVHIPGSLALLYELGPGMASRARDCLPLDLSLVLLDEGSTNMSNAAASLRGKGFAVLGKVDAGIERWSAARGTPASTDTAAGTEPPPGTVLDVDDPGARRVDDAVQIPIELLWSRVHEVPRGDPIVVAAGYGVRAALAIGILERDGFDRIVFWRSSRP